MDETTASGEIMGERDPQGRPEEVTDEDVQDILDQGEAGVNDLIAAYEPIEKGYFSAVTPIQSPAAYSTNTNFSDFDCRPGERNSRS